MIKLKNLGIPGPTEATERWMQGKPDLLAQKILADELCSYERDFVAKIIQGNPPKKERGPKISSLKAVAAGLIRFWRKDVDGWEEKDAIIKDIERLLDVGETMARKYLTQLDEPSTKAQAQQRLIFDRAKRDRELLLSSEDPEHLEIVMAQRARDLTPISEK